jgi:hypothetical protein
MEKRNPANDSSFTSLFMSAYGAIIILLFAYMIIKVWNPMDSIHTMDELLIINLIILLSS